MKRLLTILLALVMVLALGTSAFADGPGSITVENATVGQNYAGYKIFDATWDGDKVAYTIVSSDTTANHWFTPDRYEPKQSFELVRVGSSDVYNVLVKGGEDDTSIRAWVLDQQLPASPDLTVVTADSTMVKWNLVDYGYYLVTSSLKALVTVSNVNGDITIIDKNQWPSWETPPEPPTPGPEDPPKPEDYEDPQPGKNVSSDGYWYSPTSTAALGDTVYFKINAYVPKYNQDKQVYEYIFTDTLDDGLSYDTGSLTLTLNGTVLADTYYDIDVDDQKITVTISVYGMADYPTDGSLEIKFTATVTEDAVHINENEALMGWTQFDPTSPPTDPDDPNGDNPPGSPPPYDPDLPPSEQPPGTTPPPSTTKTYVYGFPKLQKYAEEAEDEAELEGATFVLYDAETGGSPIPVVLVDPAVPGVYRVALLGETGVEIEAGYATIFGLDTGTFWLEETGAPAGYNPLTAREQVVITRDNVDDEDGLVVTTVDVVNMTGTLLPETGGIGTKIFYILGGILALGALVLLVSRRRMVNGR